MESSTRRRSAGSGYNSPKMSRPRASSTVYPSTRDHSWLPQVTRPPGSTKASITEMWSTIDRKSTRLNSSHDQISYAVFCLKKKKEDNTQDVSAEFSKHTLC